MLVRLFGPPRVQFVLPEVLSSHQPWCWGEGAESIRMQEACESRPERKQLGRLYVLP